MRIVTGAIGPYLILLILLFLISCAPQASGPNGGIGGKLESETPGPQEKEQAKEFSLQIVQSFFTKDCDVLFNALINPVRVLDNADPPQEKTEEFKRWLCNTVLQSVRGNKTFQEYQDSYDVIVLDHNDYRSRVLQDSPHRFPLTPNEYVFRGWHAKANKTEFMSDDLLEFAVKKTDDGWKVSSLGS